MICPRLAILAFAMAFAIAGCERESLPTQPVLGPESSEVNLALEHLTDADGSHAIHASWSAVPGATGYEWRRIDAGQGKAEAAWEFTTSHELLLPVEPEQESATRVEVRGVDAGGRARGRTLVGAFNGRSIAPRVRISYPNPPLASCRQTSSVVYFEWQGEDVDGPHGLPRESRWILLELDRCLTAVEYTVLDPFADVADDDPRWSEWERYRARGRRAHLPEAVEIPDLEVGRSYLFAVQVRDQHRLVNPEFTWGRNVRNIQVAASPKMPLMFLRSDLLGSLQFVGVDNQREYEVISGHSPSFQVRGSAEEYGGRLDAIRYGWDVLDPADPNDPGWEIPWQDYDSFTAPLPRNFDSGTHRFVVQLRDSAGGLTRAQITLRFLSVPPLGERKELLLVDDDRRFENGNPAGDSAHDAHWAALLQASLPAGAEWDVIDAASDPQLLTLAKLLEYRAVVWATSSSSFSFFATRFPLGPHGYNWVEAYQRFAGNMLRVGPGAARSTIPNNAAIVWPSPLDGQLASPLGVGGGEPGYASQLFCIDVLDVIRPAVGFIWGEHDTVGHIERTLPCDGLGSAHPAPAFALRFASAASLPALRPNAARVSREPTYQFVTEEFYNANTTTRHLVVEPRDCVLPMFIWSSRNAEGLGEGFNCGEASAVDGAPTAVASFASSDSKPWPGTADFLWGFDPLGFEDEEVEAALAWIFQEHWQLEP